MEEKDMKKHLFCTALLAGAMLTACGSSNQENQTAESYELKLAQNASSTEADKQRQFQAYLENYLEKDILESVSDIKSAAVTLNAPATVDIDANSDEEIVISAILELEDGLSTYSAEELADMLAKGVGNTSTDNIMIMDTNGNQLFPQLP